MGAFQIGTSNFNKFSSDFVLVEYLIFVEKWLLIGIFVHHLSSNRRLWRRVNRAKPKLTSYNERLELKSKYFWNKIIKRRIKQWQWNFFYHFLIKSSNLTVYLIILQKWLYYALICLWFYRSFGLEFYLKSSLKSSQIQIKLLTTGLSSL